MPSEFRSPKGRLGKDDLVKIKQKFDDQGLQSSIPCDVSEVQEDVIEALSILEKDKP